MTAALWHFRLLDVEQQQTAIRRLAALGYGDHEISRLTGVHVHEVRRAIGEGLRILSEHRQRERAA